MKSIVRLVILCGALGLGQPSLAAPTPAPEATATTATPNALALARRYMAAVHLDRTMSALANNMAPVIIDQQLQAHPELKEHMTPELRQAMIEVISEAVLERLPAMNDKMLSIVAETFTEQELTELVAFYESPTGQAVMEKAPSMMRRIPELMATINMPTDEEIGARLCKKIDCKAAGDHSKPTKS